jgi:Ca-activated chloride channel family protein
MQTTAELPMLPDTIPSDAEAGFGLLRTDVGALPLIALEVNARLEGLVAQTQVQQVFFNSHPTPLEATYIFPLPDRAAVTSFRLEVAGRVIVGDLQERHKARQTYTEAIETGHRAAIAEEERPGVFTMRVGNLPPGEQAVVRLTMVGPMPVREGEVTYRFPLVVAPRYMPGVALAGQSVGLGVAQDTHLVPDASRISPPVMLPGFSSPVRLSIAIDVPYSALEPHDFRSSLHTLVEANTEEGKRFIMRPGEKLDRDFVLRYHIAKSSLHTALTLQADPIGDEGAWLLTVVPPSMAKSQAQPRSIVFVLDRSGSMGGWKMVTARRAVSRMIETLTEQDRFSVLAFDTTIDTPPEFDGHSLVAGTDRMRFRATEFLNTVEARGGTEMAQPLNIAVDQLSRCSGQAILVLITDGQVGNEDHILRQLGQKINTIRVFTIGIDHAVNAGFLRRLADLGGGACELVESDRRLDEVMEQIQRTISTPVLSTLRISGEGLLPETLSPTRVPDVFSGVPVQLTGRYRGKAPEKVQLTGKGANGEEVVLNATAHQGSELTRQIWGRSRIRDLEDRYAAGERGTLEQQIVETSLRFGVLSRFTAFVAVDRVEVVNPGGEVTVKVQPVESAMRRDAEPEAMLEMQALVGRAAGAIGDAESRAKLRKMSPPASMRLTRPASLASEPRSASQGILGRILGMFGGGSRDEQKREEPKQTPAAAPKPQDVRPAKDVIADLIKQLRTWASLAEDERLKLVAQVLAFVTTLRNGNDAHPTTPELERVMKEIQQSPSQAKVDELIVLLEQRPEVNSGGEQRAFWK